jgi:hypothetical protein
MTILFLKKWLMVSASLVLSALLWMGVQVFRVFRIPEPTQDPAPALRMSGLTDLPLEDVFSRPGEEDIERRAASLKLSGTIQLETGESETRGAEFVGLVDDEETGRQHLVSVGDALGPFTIREIGREYMVFGTDSRNWKVEMTGSARAWSGRGDRDGGGQDENQISWEDMPALETTRFGKRVADNQWVIQREAIHAYVRELIENPARAIDLYGSFSTAPPGGETGFAGFRIEMQGEQDFLRAMGLQDGMVIRAVNSMEMSSQARAEFMVRTFMRGDLGAVILDIDDVDGEIGKKIYIIR